MNLNNLKITSNRSFNRDTSRCFDFFGGLFGSYLTNTNIKSTRLYIMCYQNFITDDDNNNNAFISNENHI